MEYATAEFDMLICSKKSGVSLFNPVCPSNLIIILPLHSHPHWSGGDLWKGKERFLIYMSLLFVYRFIVPAGKLGCHPEMEMSFCKIPFEAFKEWVKIQLVCS